MATVSSYSSSSSWPNPNPNNPTNPNPNSGSHSGNNSAALTTITTTQNHPSLLSPLPPNPSSGDPDDNVRDWLNQYLPGTHSDQNHLAVTIPASVSLAEKLSPVAGDSDHHLPDTHSDQNHLSVTIPALSPVSGKLTSVAGAPVSLLHVSFNQDDGCFSCGLSHGFRIYNCEPYREIFRRDFETGGGIALVEMLFRCNILALVGGGNEPYYPTNKVMIWDDHKSSCIGELSFRSEVHGVRLRRDKIIVVLEQKIFVYNFVDLKLLHQIETFVNPKGLCEVTQGGREFVLVCLGLRKGEMRIENYGVKKSKFVLAHDSRIACFSLARNGVLLATASTKGTLIRVFDTRDGTLLQEVRRGADRAEIYSLAFSPTIQWLGVSSDKGTVHVFSLKPCQVKLGIDKVIESSDHTTHVPSSSSSLSFIKGVLPKYFSSEWSVAQFRLVEGSRYIVAFGQQENTVVILGMDGSFYRCKFDPTTGGEMTQLEYHNFVKPEDSS